MLYDLFFLTSRPDTRRFFGSKAGIHIHGNNQIPHNIPDRFYLINQNPHLHVFRLLQNLKLTVFGNKQTFACSCEMLFLIKRKLEITLAANNQPQSFHLKRFLQ